MASEARSTPLVRRNALCALPLEKKVERRLTRPQITGGRPQISRQFSPKWMEREILPKIPSRMEHEMLTSMEGERVKGSPKERTETGHQKITRSKAEIQVAQDGPMLVENLVENLVKKVAKAKESPAIKMIPRWMATPCTRRRQRTRPSATTRILEVEARADPTNPTPIPTPLTTKAKEVRKVVVESHLVVVDVEKE